MANWNQWNQKAQSEQTQTEKTESLAYIDKATKEAGEQFPYIKEASEKLLETAEEIGNGLSENNLSTKSKTREGKEYTDKLVVKVEPAVKWNKETKEEEAVLHKDGTPVYAPKIELKHGNETLTLFAKENMQDGVKITAESIKKWSKDFQTGTMKPSIIKGDDIADSKASDSMKAIAQYISDNGYIQSSQEHSTMKNVAYEANQYFNAASDKVPNKDGGLVNDAYAQYKNDEYGEKVQLRSHSQPNIVVELGMTDKGEPFAKATNFEIKDDNGRFASAFINKPEDLDSYVPVKEIQDIVAQFKSGESKEQTKPKAKSNVERE